MINIQQSWQLQVLNTLIYLKRIVRKCGIIRHTEKMMKLCSKAVFLFVYLLLITNISIKVEVRP